MECLHGCVDPGGTRLRLVGWHNRREVSASASVFANGRRAWGRVDFLNDVIDGEVAVCPLWSSTIATAGVVPSAGRLESGVWRM